MSAIAIVGAGPRGAGILERLVASAAELHPGRIDVHLIDPFPAGAGRIWRRAQSPLLAMNSMAEDVTMFTDESVVCEGPIRPGPTFWEWARDHEDPDALGPELAAELRAVTATTFPSRRLQSEYLGWVLRHVIAGCRPACGCTCTGPAPPGSPRTVTPSWCTSTAAPRCASTPWCWRRATWTPPRPTRSGSWPPAPPSYGLRYLAPEQTTDTDLSVIAPGETVLVRGMGLAFIDLVVLLFEGRGGRFEPEGADGELRYLPSGAEPRLVAGSPRGAPYHSKTHYQLRAGRVPIGRFFGQAAVDALIAAPGPVDLVRDAWPLMAKEIAFGWYHELFLGHPDLVRSSWEEFSRRFAEHEWDSPAMAALIADAVPDALDRIDFAALARPLDGVAAPDLAALQPLVRAHIAEDLRQHVDERHTAHLGAFTAMLGVYGQLARLQPALSPRSQARDLGWWQGFFNAVASGPPGFRVRQLLALSRAGFVDFLGPGMWVDVAADGFRAGSAALSGAAPVLAPVLVEARLPDSSITRTTDPLLSALLQAGAVSEDVVVDDDGTVLRGTGLIRVRSTDGAVVDAAGRAHPRRFAVGPHTTVRAGGAFTRPGLNALSLRYNDAVARAVLRSLPRAARAAA